MKKTIKEGIKMVIDADGSITTLVVRASKKKLIHFLDILIPDEPVKDKTAEKSMDPVQTNGDK